MRWLSRHQTAALLVALVVVTWGALWVIYDYRSPVSQFMRAWGTVRVDGWSASELDAVCVRLEPAPDLSTSVALTVTAEQAIAAASTAYPGGHVRQVALGSFRDTCSGATASLVWAVVIAWDPAASTSAPLQRGIVIVDAATGKLIVSADTGR